jgi:hypothetical protein
MEFPALCALVALAGGMTLAGCASAPRIGSEANREVDLTRFRTYALLPLPDRIENADPGAILRVAVPVKEEVHAAMARLGYREAAEKEADVVLHVRGERVPKVDVTDWGYSYHGYGRWGMHYGPGGVTVDQYDEGTIAIEAFPRDSRVLAWVGWAKDRVYGDIEAERIRLCVREILARFPPAAPSNGSSAPGR